MLSFISEQNNKKVARGNKTILGIRHQNYPKIDPFRLVCTKLKPLGSEFPPENHCSS